MLWEVEIRSNSGQIDREGRRVVAEARAFDARSIRDVRAAHAFLIQGDLDRNAVARITEELLADTVVETYEIRPLGTNGDGDSAAATSAENKHPLTLNVLYKAGVTNNVADSAKRALRELGFDVEAVATCRKYEFNTDAERTELERVARRVLANEAVEQIVWGPLRMTSISLGSDYRFQLMTVPLRGMNDEQLAELSRTGQLYLSLTEMQTIQSHFVQQDRDPTDAELETIAQTWSEHCSHKTLAGRIRYREWNKAPQAGSSGLPEQPPTRELQFDNMLKETIFAATTEIRHRLGDDDWCVSVFKDNAGIVKFDDRQNVCMKVETHNHPSALEPYGGANTGLGGVIRDPLGTGLGARPVCNTDVFCFAPPATPAESLPPGVLHPRVVMQGVVAGVRDYGNRMGIPTVNGAVYFDERYLGNPLVYCGNVAMIPADKCEKQVRPGDAIVAVGGRTGRDGIHGATFSSAELTEQSETLSGGAVQIGNAITEKMVMDVILQARDRGLYSAITDCGAGGFSSAVGEMGEETGAEVWLDRAPLKYSGLSYTEIWISEAQERMVLSVPPEHWNEFHQLCTSEGVETTIIGRFTGTGRLVLKYHDAQVADLSMEFLHGGRPPVVRDAIYVAPKLSSSLATGEARLSATESLLRILSSLNVCSKEWIIRQYDHEVQAGSVVKPLVGVNNDGPSDAAVVRPDLRSLRGLVVANGMNPHYGDLDPYWMAASAIDEAVRNCVAVGADPQRIAILDNFCWGNTERPETLGSLVRAALACRDIALAYGTPFISGKDSLNNEFAYVDASGRKQTVAIPPSLLISALGQMDDVTRAVTMDLKSAGNLLYLVGATKDEMGGSHYALVNGMTGGAVPRVDPMLAPRIFTVVHEALRRGLVRGCHDLSEGGLAAAAAEMAIAGDWGVSLELQSLAQSSATRDDLVLLFSESNTRFLLEVPSAQREALESLLHGFPLVPVGTVTETPQIRIAGRDGQSLIDLPVEEARTAWKRALRWD